MPAPHRQISPAYAFDFTPPAVRRLRCARAAPLCRRFARCFNSEKTIRTGRPIAVARNSDPPCVIARRDGNVPPAPRHALAARHGKLYEYTV
jgi:hypothetical protein